MASESSKSLVIISVGVEHSPLLQNFLDAGLQLTILPNTTGDFSLTDDNGSEKGNDIWYHHEIIKLASSIVPDDFAQSSLAKIFTKPISQTRLPLTDAERFLIQWVSEQHKAKQDFTDFFVALNEYSNKKISVHPLKLPENALALQGEDFDIPLRYFQVTGFIDRKAEIKPDLDELRNLLNETKESKSNKKAKPKIAIKGLDIKRDILGEQAKKALTEADAILILASDPCSLGILLLHKEFTRVVRESKAPSTLVCPIKFSFREQFILELLSIKPSLIGIAELCSGIIDHLVVGPDDASEVKTLRTQGFNVLMEDLTKIKDAQGLSTILKGLGISLNDISVESEDQGKKRSLEELVTKLTYSTTDNSTSDIVDIVEEAETTVELAGNQVTRQKKPKPVIKLQDTETRNYDFEDPELVLTQEMIETLMEELTEDFTPPDDKLSTTPAEKTEEKITEESQEAFTETIENFLSFEESSNRTEMVQKIGERITKNADMAGYAAKKLTSTLISSKTPPQFFEEYVSLIKTRPLLFIKELVDWLVADIETPDYVTFSQKSLIIVKIGRIETPFVEQILEHLVKFRMTQKISPKKKEHLRTIIGMITARDVTLQRKAIREYLTHYEIAKKPDDVWLGLLKYDAALVALEIIEHESKRGVKIVQDALTRDLGSFGHIVYEVFAAYQKGDIESVLSAAGPLSDGLVRKQKRVELAEKITKFGSVPIEILANNVQIDPKELESLVYEMINENEINAKIGVVEGRLCIIQLGEKENNDQTNNG
ncbi:hypothetical protein CEE45_10730 [Candidatus Heimdallarchaeota archaeon B3_Heim]|nr:MAG: hypothetical protein CEE45_10730 [Candidatus Heimdallarchaeota archaeon B3_Heim]